MGSSYNILTVEDIIELHDKLIEDFGGTSGFDSNNQGRIDFIASNLTQEMFGIELYKGLFIKASMLLFFITKDHCFVDGNKRTAFNACEVFLAINGYLLKDDFDWVEFVENVASKNMNEVPVDEFLAFICVVLENKSYFDEELLAD